MTHLSNIQPFMGSLLKLALAQDSDCFDQSDGAGGWGFVSLA